MISSRYRTAQGTQVPTIVLINAPAGTGKDTIGKALVEEGFAPEAFKAPLFWLVPEAMEMNSWDFAFNYEDKIGWKDDKSGVYGLPVGKSVRDLMIHTSENFIKPFFGKDYFGRSLARRIKEEEDTLGYKIYWVITDGGFDAEVFALINEFGHRVRIVQVEREGHRSFEGDSRDWLNVAGVETYRFDTTEGNERVIRFILDKL